MKAFIWPLVMFLWKEFSDHLHDKSSLFALTFYFSDCLIRVEKLENDIMYGLENIIWIIELWIDFTSEILTVSYGFCLLWSSQYYIWWSKTLSGIHCPHSQRGCLESLLNSILQKVFTWENLPWLNVIVSLSGTFETI